MIRTHHTEHGAADRRGVRGTQSTGSRDRRVVPPALLAHPLFQLFRQLSFCSTTDFLSASL